MEIATPWVSGISTQLIIAGNIQNQGIELALNTIPFQNEDWEWGLDFTWTKNTSKIVELHPDAAEYISLAGQVNAYDSVSYTHLDVYKRQVYERLDGSE